MLASPINAVMGPGAGSCMDTTDERLFRELFPDRTIASKSMVQLNSPSQKNRLKIRSLPKKQRIEWEVRTQLAEVVHALEQQGIALLIAPVRDKYLTYEI